MDEGMQQFQQSLIELEIEAEHLLLARNQVIENDKERNGNREALTALRKRAKTTKTSIKFPFESIMKDIGKSGSKNVPLVKEICGTCGNHDEKEKDLDDVSREVMFLLAFHFMLLTLSWIKKTLGRSHCYEKTRI
ncbi:P53 AND DNA DAMAGE-REGULATED PROTEIN [Salix koriyanagi]|uniref:P53 AND DNA DAMAGE-REGULATED PROTEIN n=1 Tax=Salix koriyanagi TaxID=2511006 RepID=A0A9Q0YTQ7_9ROSI|nr:P53 AND DNA DAMAGE-REGULATED PROTEIN [Salix koriyanagi]